jgi:hypothetical protein
MSQLALGFVPQLDRDALEQGLGDFGPETPAVAFVAGGGAELALVFAAAQRAKGRVGREWVHRR